MGNQFSKMNQTQTQMDFYDNVRDFEHIVEQMMIDAENYVDEPIIETVDEYSKRITDAGDEMKKYSDAMGELRIELKSATTTAERKQEIREMIFGGIIQKATNGVQNVVNQIKRTSIRPAKNRQSKCEICDGPAAIMVAGINLMACGQSCADLLYLRDGV